MGDGARKIGDGIHGTPTYDDNGEVAFINGNNLMNGEIAITSQTKYVDDTQKTAHDNNLNLDTILMSINGTIGNLAWYNGENIMLGKSAAYIEVGDFDKAFMYILLQTNGVKKYFLDNLTGTTIKNLGLKTIRETPAKAPNRAEQAAIGSFFRTFDKLLTATQRKVTGLKQLKAAYLQQMFPQDGERVPRVRFEGFTADWAETRLGDIADIVRGASPRPIQDPKWFDESSDVGWLRISDVTEQDGRIRHLGQKISKAGQSKTRVLIEPHLLLSIAATVGKPVINYIKTGVHDGFLIFLNPQFEHEFMFQWLEMFRTNWQQYGQPGSQVNLNSDLVKNQELCIPSRAEQVVIGGFFGNLDTQIASQSEKLEQLKQLKSAYLQKMFI